jgi:hypothetical protein
MNPAYRIIGLSDREQWEEALLPIDHAYWHSWRANEALSRGTGQPAYLFTCERADGRGRAACTFAERIWADSVDIFTPAGFAGFVAKGDDSGVREAWLDFVASRGYVCGYFALHPKVCVSHVHDSISATNNLYALDLADGSEAVLAKASRTVRRSVGEWVKSRRDYVTDRPAIRDFLLREYPAFMSRAGANPQAIWSRPVLEAMLADPALLMVAAADELGVCAAYTFAVTGKGSECHLNVSTRDGREFTTALLAWGLQQLAGMGVRWLHLGGGVRPGDAIAQAKEKFKPDEASLLVAKEVYDPAAYRRLCEQSGRDVGASGFFPSYRACA